MSSEQERIERTFHSNGNIESEVTYRGEFIEGLSRNWHENGTLQSSVPMKRSMMHGTRKVWNGDGTLLDETDFFMGTGKFRTFHPNGVINGEMTLKNGIPHGPQQVWDETGDLIGTQFFVSGKRVSERAYLAAQAKDTTLPVAKLDNLESHESLSPTQTSVSPNQFPDAVDARAWLSGASDEESRTLGELPSRAASADLLNELFDLGATEVLVLNRVEDVDGSENSGELLIRLPERGSRRRAIIKRCNTLNRMLGFRETADNGQQWIHIALD